MVLQSLKSEVQTSPILILVYFFFVFFLSLNESEAVAREILPLDIISFLIM